jgi:hypothetical protein
MIWNPAESFAPKVKEEYKEIVTLDSAINIITDQLTDQSIFRLDAAGLYYTIRQDNPKDPKTGKRKNDSWLEPETVGDDFLEGRPAWVFYINSIYEEGCSLVWDGHDTVILVDALTGELHFFTGTGG